LSKTVNTHVYLQNINTNVVVLWVFSSTVVKTYKGLLVFKRCWTHDMGLRVC